MNFVTLNIRQGLALFSYYDQCRTICLSKGHRYIPTGTAEFSNLLSAESGSLTTARRPGAAWRGVARRGAARCGSAPDRSFLLASLVASFLFASTAYRADTSLSLSPFVSQNGPVPENYHGRVIFQPESSRARHLWDLKASPHARTVALTVSRLRTV